MQFTSDLKSELAVMLPLMKFGVMYIYCYFLLAHFHLLMMNNVSNCLHQISLIIFKNELFSEELIGNFFFKPFLPVYFKIIVAHVDINVL